MNAKVEVSDETVKNLLCSAFEGGSNYWIDHIELPKEKRVEQAEYFHECPVYGQGIIIHTQDDAPEDKKVVTLDRAALEKGMQIFCDKYPAHFADMVAENDDAITADIYLQCCIFGEAIYG